VFFIVLISNKPQNVKIFYMCGL